MSVSLPETHLPIYGEPWPLRCKYYCIDSIGHLSIYMYSYLRNIPYSFFSLIYQLG